MTVTHLYLPWSPFAVQQKIETMLSVLCRPRWPRQVRQCCKMSNSFATNIANVNNPLKFTPHSKRASQLLLKMMIWHLTPGSIGLWFSPIVGELT
jgi:hypothetical protein